jgi:hypothetical protein
LAVDPDSYMSLNEILLLLTKKLVEHKLMISCYHSMRNGMHGPVCFLMQMILIQKIFWQIKIPAFRM